MTLTEFKAWFEGYTEGLEAAPTKAQFDRIKEKVKEIDGTVTTHTVYIDRYVHPYSRPYYSWPNYLTGTLALGTGISGISGTEFQSSSSATLKNAGYAEVFDSTAAMYALGKADAQVN